MRIEVNNMLFDDALDDCYKTIHTTQGHSFVFVQALDLGMNHARLRKPHKVRYWGVYDEMEPVDSITRALQSGSRWPLLPLKD